MSRLRLEHITTVEELRARAPAWDDLWRRSAVALPTARAELTALWLDHFAPRAWFLGLTVSDGDRMVAALPLVGRRVKRVVRAGDLTWNYWSPNGELLLDETGDAQSALDLLAAAIQRDTPWPLLWLEMPPIETPRWQGLVAALRRRGAASRSLFRFLLNPVEVRPRYEIGTVTVQGPFDDYLASRSDSLRRNLPKELRRLERLGPVALKRLDGLDPGEVEGPLDLAWQIEDRGWKGRASGSVLRTPGIREFYLAQGRVLAGWGALRLTFLEHGGRPIAFELGWQGKGVYHSFKVGYDPKCAGSSPGNLLRLFLIRSLCEEVGPRQAGQLPHVDFQGPLTDTLRGWATGSYPIGRIVASTGGLRGRVMMAGYRAGAALARRSSVARDRERDRR